MAGNSHGFSLLLRRIFQDSEVEQRGGRVKKTIIQSPCLKLGISTNMKYSWTFRKFFTSCGYRLYLFGVIWTAVSEENNDMYGHQYSHHYEFIWFICLISIVIRNNQETIHSSFASATGTSSPDLLPRTADIEGLSSDVRARASTGAAGDGTGLSNTWTLSHKRYYGYIWWHGYDMIV